MHPILNIKINEYSKGVQLYLCMILSWESYIHFKAHGREFDAKQAFKNYYNNARHFYENHPLHGVFPSVDKRDVALKAIIEIADKWLKMPSEDNARVFTRIVSHAIPKSHQEKSMEIMVVDDFIEQIQLDLF